MSLIPGWRKPAARSNRWAVSQVNQPQVFEAVVTNRTDDEWYVKVPAFARTRFRDRLWGPCEPADAPVEVGDEVLISVSDQGVPWLMTGNGDGAGPRGPEGPPGPPGTSVEIAGSVATEDDLDGSGLTVGHGLIVGDTGHLWIWDGTGFTDAGEIRGPQGPQGRQGVRGPEGPQGEPGPAPPPWAALECGQTGLLPGDLEDHISSCPLGNWQIIGGDGDHGVELDTNTFDKHHSPGNNVIRLAPGRLYVLYHVIALRSTSSEREQLGQPVPPRGARQCHLRLCTPWVQADPPHTGHSRAPANRVANIASIPGSGVSSCSPQTQTWLHTPVNELQVHWRKPRKSIPWRLEHYRLIVVSLADLSALPILWTRPSTRAPVSDPGASALRRGVMPYKTGIDTDTVNDPAAGPSRRWRDRTAPSGWGP